MTSDEMESKIKFILDTQAQNTVDISELKVTVSELATTVAVIGNSVNVLTAHGETLHQTVTMMAMQAEADRQIIQNRMNRMDERMERFEHKAEADHQLMRARMEQFERKSEAYYQLMRELIERMDNRKN